LAKKFKTMKKPSILLLFCLLVSSSLMAAKVTFIKGDASIFKGKKSFLIEFDWSQASFDGLESEAEYIKFTRNKKKEKADEWEKDWQNDKKNLVPYYQEFLSSRLKNLEASFNVDDPDSDYKMVIRPSHVDTGSPVKYSSIEMRIHVLDKEGKEVAIIAVPMVRGAQMGPMTPTIGMRLKMALANSGNLLAKFLKKNIG
jgi:hypothetical protein